MLGVVTGNGLEATLLRGGDVLIAESRKSQNDGEVPVSVNVLRHGTRRALRNLFEQGAREDAHQVLQETGKRGKEATDETALLEVALGGLGDEDGCVDVDILVRLVDTLHDVLSLHADMLRVGVTGEELAETKGRKDAGQVVKEGRVGVAAGVVGVARLLGAGLVALLLISVTDDRGGVLTAEVGRLEILGRLTTLNERSHGARRHRSRGEGKHGKEDTGDKNHGARRTGRVRSKVKNEGRVEEIPGEREGGGGDEDEETTKVGRFSWTFMSAAGKKQRRNKSMSGACNSSRERTSIASVSSVSVTGKWRMANRCGRVTHRGGNNCSLRRDRRSLLNQVPGRK